MNFREAPGEQVDWLDTLPGVFSNFEYTDQQFYCHPVVRRILSLARKLGYESLLVERLKPESCEEFKDEIEAMRIRMPSCTGADAFRLAFFKKDTSHTPAPGDLLGYAVVVTFHIPAYESHQTTHIQEAILLPCRTASENNFVHCGRDYVLKTSLGDFQIYGVLYAQQNGFTTVCAHVSLRTMLACILPEADVSYKEINEICGIDHRSNRVGSREKGEHGLTPDQLILVIQKKGLTSYKLIHEPKKGAWATVWKWLYMKILKKEYYFKLEYPGEFQEDLYGLVESRGPALLAFELAGEGGRHVIPVIGHTFNEDTWVIDANREYFDHDLAYYPSENWLSSYVVHDDNFGPLHCLPRHYLKKKNFRLLIGGYPFKPEFNSPEIEALGLDTAKAIAALLGGIGFNSWLDRFILYALENQLVLRTLLLERREILSHLESLTDRNETPFEIERVREIGEKMTQDSSFRFYMVEVSAPELFPASRRKFGELVYRVKGLGEDEENSQAPVNWMDHLVFARLPGILLFPEDDQESTVEMKLFHIKLTGHTSLFEKCPA